MGRLFAPTAFPAALESTGFDKIEQPATSSHRSTTGNLKRALRLAGMRPLPRLPGRKPVDLRGKRILVTGASSGIGEIGAEMLAAEGATVIAVARREHLLADLVDRIVARGGNAIAIPANLADLDAIDD
ncbi:MAG: hypothetical protein QOD39_1538, partial [Mycobacterium sp.]|nr:hypothetical protein [Mycobacterium sp.]